MADSKPSCTCASAEPPGGMTTLSRLRCLAPAVAPEMPTKLGRPCFDWVASPGRTVTTSFPSRSPMMVGSAPAETSRSPMAVSISRSLRMPLSFVVRSRFHCLPELGRIALRVHLEHLAVDDGLFAVAAPVIDHRSLVPDYVERNHVSAFGVASQ